MLSKAISKKSLDSGIYLCPSKRRKRKNSSYEPVGRGFESLQARQAKKTSQNVMSFLLSREGQVVYPSSISKELKKHCVLQCFFFFYCYWNFKFLSFFNCSQSPTFLQIKNYIRFLWPQTKISSKGTRCGVLFDSYTKILSQFRLLKSFYNTVDNFFHLMV